MQSKSAAAAPKFMELKKLLKEKGLTKADLDKCIGVQQLLLLAENKGVLLDTPAPDVVLTCSSPTVAALNQTRSDQVAIRKLAAGKKRAENTTKESVDHHAIAAAQAAAQAQIDAERKAFEDAKGALVLQARAAYDAEVAAVAWAVEQQAAADARQAAYDAEVAAVAMAIEQQAAADARQAAYDAEVAAVALAVEQQAAADAAEAAKQALLAQQAATEPPPPILDDFFSDDSSDCDSEAHDAEGDKKMEELREALRAVLWVMDNSRRWKRLLYAFVGAAIFGWWQSSRHDLHTHMFYREPTGFGDTLF